MATKKLTNDLKAKIVPNIAEIKSVISTLVNNFVEEEKGNRVTNNNMTGLTVKLMAAIDGQITTTPPEPKKE